MSTLASGQGALTGLNLDDDETTNPVVYDVFQNRAQTPTASPEFIQQNYGTGAMPIFEWVRTVQTGTRSLILTTAVIKIFLKNTETL